MIIVVSLMTVFWCEYATRRRHVRAADEGHRRRLDALEEQMWHFRSILRILRVRLGLHIARTEPHKSSGRIPWSRPEPHPTLLSSKQREELRRKFLSTFGRALVDGASRNRGRQGHDGSRRLAFTSLGAAQRAKSLARALTQTEVAVTEAGNRDTSHRKGQRPVELPPMTRGCVPVVSIP